VQLTQLLVIAALISRVSADEEVEIVCPKSIFADVEPEAGQIILMIMSVIASLPIMGIGL
jgi:hypothetical protein